MRTSLGLIILVTFTILFDPANSMALSGKVVGLTNQLTFVIESGSQSKTTVTIGGIYPPDDMSPSLAKQLMSSRMWMRNVEVRGYGNGFASDIIVEGYSLKRALLDDGWRTTPPTNQQKATVETPPSSQVTILENKGVNPNPTSPPQDTAPYIPNKQTTAALHTPSGSHNTPNNSQAASHRKEDSEKILQNPRFFIGGALGGNFFNNSPDYYPIENKGILAGLAFRSFLTEYAGIGASSIYVHHTGKDNVSLYGTNWDINDVDYNGYGNFIDFLFTPFGKDGSLIPYLMASPGFVSYSVSGSATEKSTGITLTLDNYTDETTAFSFGGGLLYAPKQEGFSFGIEGRHIIFSESEAYEPSSTTSIYMLGGYMF